MPTYYYCPKVADITRMLTEGIIVLLELPIPKAKEANVSTPIPWCLISRTLEVLPSQPKFSLFTLAVTAFNVLVALWTLLCFCNSILLILGVKWPFLWETPCTHSHMHHACICLFRQGPTKHQTLHKPWGHISEQSRWSPCPRGAYLLAAKVDSNANKLLLMLVVISGDRAVKKKKTKVRDKYTGILKQLFSAFSWLSSQYIHQTLCVHVCMLSCCMSNSLQPHGCMDCSPPGSSVHGILQARTEWAAMPFSRGYSGPRDWTCIFYVSHIGWFFVTSSTWEAHQTL